MVSAKPCGFVSDPMEKGDRISTGLSPTQNRPVNPRLSLDFFYDQKSAPTRVTSSRGYWIANFDFTNMLQCYSSIVCEQGGLRRGTGGHELFLSATTEKKNFASERKYTKHPSPPSYRYLSSPLT